MWSDKVKRQFIVLKIKHPNIFTGHCTDYSINGNLIEPNQKTNCKTFTEKPCPDFYRSNETYKCKFLSIVSKLIHFRGLWYTLRGIKCAAVFQLAKQYYPVRFTVMIQTWVSINLILKENVKTQTSTHILLIWNTGFINHWQLN